jgi:flavorubredoxin
MKKISDRIFYVGVNDDTKTLFEGLWPLPYGVSYNSYVVADEKVALIDTVEHDFEEDFLYNISEAIGDRAVDYLVVNHMEPDHSSLTAYMLDKYPEMKIVANAKTVPMLKGYYGTPEDRILVMKEGDTLSLGSCALSFHMIPMVHWPETMVTWLAEENTVFSGDAFGTFGMVNADVVDSEGTFESFRDEMMRYYSNIVGKYGTPVQTALKKLSGLDVKRICSTHGPVWEKSVAEVVALYDKMSRYEVERGVCIAYGSMYGNTSAAAEALAEELRKLGVPVAVHDLAGNVNPGLGLSGALRDVFKYDTIVAASPTYNNGIFPPVETFMKALQSRLIKGRRFYALGSYTWAGSSVNLLNAMAQTMDFEVLAPGLSFAQAYSEQKCNMPEIAALIKG